MTSDLLEENQELRKEIAKLRSNSFTVSAMTEQKLKLALEKGEQLEKENAELKEKNEGYCRSRDRLISIGFPTFKDCKEYAEHLTKAKEIINDFLLMAKVEHLKDRYETVDEAEQFISEVEK
jgi:cell division septum initiation protein DivIVA